MKHNTNNSEAVSPVVGVMLMVAVTVMLAAVCAAFVFGMADDIKSVKVVTIVPHRDSATQITFTNYGGADVGKLKYINLTAYETGSTTVDGVLGNAALSKTKITGTFDSDNRVVATGTFLDGTVSVLLDTSV